VKPVRLHEDKARAVEAYVSVSNILSFLHILERIIVDIHAKLKGGDALIYRALRAVDAYITFHYYYPEENDYEKGEKDYVLEEESRIFEDWCIENSLHNELNGQTLDSLGVYTAIEAPIIKYKGQDGQERDRSFYEPKFATATKFSYLVYGNSPEISRRYASICMIASAPGHGLKGKWAERKRFDEAMEWR
jgi:hypothetical protein